MILWKWLYKRTLRSKPTGTVLRTHANKCLSQPVEWPAGQVTGTVTPGQVSALLAFSRCHAADSQNREEDEAVAEAGSSEDYQSPSLISAQHCRSCYRGSTSCVADTVPGVEPMCHSPEAMLEKRPSWNSKLGSNRNFFWREYSTLCLSTEDAFQDSQWILAPR